jgi:hypothetical protein
VAFVLLGMSSSAGWARRADGVIAFERAGNQVWVMHRNATYALLLLDNAPEGVAWASTGSRIAFARSEGIWVANADGAGEHLAIPGGDMPAWTPDGRIAYVFSTQAGPELAVADGDGTHVRVLTAPSQFTSLQTPLVLPTGRIVITGTQASGQIASQWIVNRTGSRIRSVNAPLGLGGDPVVVASAAPRGNRVTIHDNDGEQDVWEQGTLHGTTVTVDPAWRFSTFSLGGAQWSPGGDAILTQVATASNPGEPYQPTESQLGIYNPAVAPPLDLTLLGSASADTTFGFSWSPTCTILRFASHRTIRGTPRQDRICVVGRDDTVLGGRGDDVIDVQGLHNTVRGGAGRDVIAIHGPANIVDGGRGSDLINTRRARRFNTINGGTGDNVCFANNGDRIAHCHAEL